MNQHHIDTTPLVTVSEAATDLKLSYSRALELVRAHPAVVLKYGRWLLPASALDDIRSRDTRRGRRWPARQEVPMTREDIQSLRTEAAEAGDTEQVALCDEALWGDDVARNECARAIADARAQRDDDE